MFRLIGFLIKLADVYPITMSILGALTAIGVISVIRWLVSSLNTSGATALPSTLAPSSKTSTASLTASVAKEKIRQKLEDLYHQNKIGKDVLDDLLSAFQIWIPKVPQPTVSSEPRASKSVLTSSSAATACSKAVEISQKTSGYFSSENIKTMLISGCALFVLSAYLFVRSYWEQIPSSLKFLSLVLATVGIHIGGRKLIGKKETPKTSETLLTLATLLVPFNFYAGNYLLLNGTFSAFGSWAFGAAAMSVAGLYTAHYLPTIAMGIVMGTGVVGSFVFGGMALGITSQTQQLVTAIGTALLFATSVFVSMSNYIQTGMRRVVYGACALVVVGLIANGLFLHTTNHLPTVATLAVIGSIFAVEARLVGYQFAYGAGLCFAGAVAVLLHHFEIPAYKYGLFFIPAGVLATVRAWTFERQKKGELAAPYFHLGQLAIAGSLLAIFPSFTFYVESGFIILLFILLMATAAYALNGLLYRSPVFMYLGEVVVLFSAWTWSCHHKLPFVESALLLSGVGSLFVVSGLFARTRFDELLGRPLSTVGLASVTGCLALLAGKWGVPLLQGGMMRTGLGVDHLTSAIFVGLMSVFAYGLVAAVRKQAALVFPALGSATLTYFFLLEKISYPINLINTSWIVVVCMALSYAAGLLSWKKISRCFAVWGEIIFAVVAFGGLASRPEAALPAMSICLAAFLPALILNSVDGVTCFLASLYSVHLIWFRSTIGGSWDERMFAYGAQLLLLNCGVVFVRTLITAWRPRHNVLPYRIFTLSFSCIGLLVALNDKTNAWQIYLAYGILALIVSQFHYRGRFGYVGTTLLLLSYELLISSRNVELIEAYSVPAGLYLLISGYLNRDNKDLRNVLYGIAQAVLYLPSFSKALNETWEMHGVFLGLESLALMLFGIHQRNRCLTFGSLFILITNGVVQSAQFLTAIPRWIYLALGGITLVGLGGLFEFQREKLIAAKNQMADAFEGWN